MRKREPPSKKAMWAQAILGVATVILGPAMILDDLRATASPMLPEPTPLEAVLRHGCGPTFLMSGVVSLMALRVDARARHKFFATHCRGCRYDRSGLEPGAVCPECGRAPE